MKSFIALLGILFTAGMSAHATVVTQLSINEGYEQVGPNSLQLRWVVLNGSALGFPDYETGVMETMDSVTFARPDGSLVPQTLEFISPSFWNVIFSEGYSSRRDIASGDYEISFIGGFLDGDGRTYDVNTALFPKHPPKLSKRSYMSLRTTPVSRSIRLVFHPFAKPRGATQAITSVMIGDTAGNTVFSQFGLPSTTATVVIPANTLLPGASYNFTLSQIISGPLPTGGQLDSHTYSVQNFFVFTTSSSAEGSIDQADGPDAEEAAFVGNR